MNNPANLLLEKLGGFAVSTHATSSMDELLQELPSIAAETVGAENCSIMISNDRALQVQAHHGSLPDEAYNERVKRGQGISGHVLATGKTLLVENMAESEFASVARYKNSGNKSMISAPIIIDGKVGGVVNISGPIGKPQFGATEALALEVIALIMGKMIQVTQLKSVLHSRFAIMSLVMKRHSSSFESLAKSAQNPEAMAKILAKSFYRELRHAGFGSAQIIDAATEIISQLGASLRKKSLKSKRDPASS